MSVDRPRCRWAEGDPLMAAYHDDEWGEVPAGDREYFERLVLEMFQAGLAWRTILHKREGFRRAFLAFDPGRVAAFGSEDVERLLTDREIVRNRGKIEAAVHAAGVFREIVGEHGSFEAFLERSRRDGVDPSDVLRGRLRFFGPTIAESFFQSVGAQPVQHDPTCWKAGR